MTISQRVDEILGRMTLEDKIGQMLCFGFSGTFPHPDIVEMIQKYRVAGFRVSPMARKFVRYLKPGSPGAERVTRRPGPSERLYTTKNAAPAVSAAGYAQVLNFLRQVSLESGAGVPLYYATDFEGNVSADFSAEGIHGFPHAMGIAASGEPELAQRVAFAIGRQMRALGINWLHSPVLDVNTHPANPEIGTRSYSARVDDVIRYSLEALKGFERAGIVATGKHFPGRGHSAEDVHFGIATIPESRERMFDLHLAPYKALIAEGLPAIMLAHSIFPGIDPEKEIATVSDAVIRDVLRGELGYEGIVMSDSFTMGGLMAKYGVVEGAVKGIRAGMDLVLLKDENVLRDELFAGLNLAVRTGEISEKQVDESVARLLAVKERFGIFDQPVITREETFSILEERSIRDTAEEAADKSLAVLRDAAGLLNSGAVRRGRILMLGHTRPAKFNNRMAHPETLFHELVRRGADVQYADYDETTGETGWKTIADAAANADWVIMSAYYDRNAVIDADDIRGYLRCAGLDQAALATRLILVTNTPYSITVPQEIGTVICTFSLFNESQQAAVKLIRGEIEAGKLGFDPGRIY